MKSKLIISVVMVLILSVLATGSGHAAEKIKEDVTGTIILCEDNTYTITSGALQGIAKSKGNESGKLLAIKVLVAKNIVAEDSDGNTYRMRGAEQVILHEGDTGDFSFLGHVNFNLVDRRGGVSDTVRIIIHIAPNGKFTMFDFGDCLPTI